MARYKRSTNQRELDLSVMADRYLSGHTLHSIAEKLCKDRSYTLSHVTIHRDLRTLRDRWLASSVRDFNHARAQELAKVDKLEQTYWTAWLDSTRPKESRTTGQEEGREKKRRATIRTEERDGDPRYLAGVMSCIDKRCKLLGLDAPNRHALEGPDGGPVEHKITGLSDEVAAQIRSKILGVQDLPPGASA